MIESSIGLGYGKNRGHGYRASLELEMKPIEPLNIEIEAMQDRSPNYMQWVDILENIDDTVRVYANSVLLTRDITLRLDWTFSPKCLYSVLCNLFMQIWIMRGFIVC